MKYIKLFEEFNEEEPSTSSDFFQDELVNTIVFDAGLEFYLEDEDSKKSLEFDICEALYLFRIDFNEDIRLYHHINLLLKNNNFRARPSLTVDSLEEIGKDIYDVLVSNIEKYEGLFA